MTDSKTTTIAILGSFPPLRGLSSYCLEMAVATASRVRVEFLSFKAMYPRRLYPGGNLADDPTFPAFDRECLRVRRRLTWYNPLSWVIEGLQTDAALLHAQWWSLPLAPVYACICLFFKLRGKPVVFTVHNVMAHEGTKSYTLISRLLFKLGDHFIVHTEANRQTMVSQYGVPPGRISIIPHGSLDFQVRGAAERDAIRGELGFSADHKVVLFFGAIRPYKGLETAITAFAAAAKAVPEARLLIAGKPWEPWTAYRSQIEALMLAERVVTHLDYIPANEVHRYFGAADLVVLPYRNFDSQSGVGSTAVAFRKPMIVSDVGGLPELVRDPRCVVAPGDPEALSRAMISCLEDPLLLESLAQQTETVAGEIGWAAIAERTCALYRRLLDGKITFVKEPC